MRLDPEHVERLKRAYSDDGTTMKFCPQRMRQLSEHLSLWEQGLAMQVLMKAVCAKKLSREQRVLLALFAYDGEEEADHEAI